MPDTNKGIKMKYIQFILIGLVLLSFSSCNKTKRRIINVTGNSHHIIDNSSNISEKSRAAYEEKSWRIDLPGGGYQDFRQHSDGSLTTTEVKPCMFCHGTKICPACNGAGGTYGRAYGGMYYPCKMCLQTGQCSSCKGEGSVTTISITDASGNTHIQSSNGYSADGGPGGTIVTDPNGRRTAVPSGGGSYPRESRSSSSEDTSNDYIETIEYAPNYTGESNDVWCEKCQEFAPRHSHIRKRVR